MVKSKLIITYYALDALINHARKNGLLKELGISDEVCGAYPQPEHGDEWETVFVESNNHSSQLNLFSVWNLDELKSAIIQQNPCGMMQGLNPPMKSVA